MNISTTTYGSVPSGFTHAPVLNKGANDTGLLPSKTSRTDPGETQNPIEPASQNPAANDNQPQKTSSEPGNNAQQQSPGKTGNNGEALTQAELQLVKELQEIDTEVRQHEMAHVAAGGRYITSGANFSYKRGPDGRRYAVAGEVGIDTSPIPGDPQATLRKMRQVKAAALAPAHPSSQDLRVASKATSSASKALSDLMIQQAKDRAAADEATAFSDLKKAAGSYERVGNLPEGDPSSFRVAV